jgi:hypothetical protein
VKELNPDLRHSMLLTRRHSMLLTRRHSMLLTRGYNTTKLKTGAIGHTSRQDRPKTDKRQTRQTGQIYRTDGTDRKDVDHAATRALGVLQCCYSGLTVVLQRGKRVVTMVLQTAQAVMMRPLVHLEYYSGVTVGSKWC